MSMDGVCQESQKLQPLREIQRESQRKFNDHNKLFYSITHQELEFVLPWSCLLLVCQLWPSGCSVLSFHSVLHPFPALQAAQNSAKSTGGGPRVGRCGIRGQDLGDLFSSLHNHTCCVLGGKVVQWSRTRLLGPTELSLNPSTATYWLWELNLSLSFFLCRMGIKIPTFPGCVDYSKILYVECFTWWLTHNWCSIQNNY